MISKPYFMETRCQNVYLIHMYKLFILTCTSLKSGYISKGVHVDAWDINIPTQAHFSKVITIYYVLFHMICQNYQEISISDKEMKRALGEKLAANTLMTKRSLSCLHQLDFKFKFEETCFVQTK